LPETIEFEGGGRWLKNAIVQLGYNGEGKGIIFVAESRDSSEQNALFFSDKGMMIDDRMLERLTWAPILPVRDSSVAPSEPVAFRPPGPRDRRQSRHTGPPTPRGSAHVTVACLLRRRRSARARYRS